MRYFVGFLIMIGLIILLIILLFGGGGKQKVPTTSKTLDSYASTGAEAVMTIDAPVNANREHRQIRISVGRDNVVYEQLKGYDGSVTLQKNFANTESAYATFLRALEHAGYTQGDTDRSLADERGYCPLGDRYIFELADGGEEIQRFWATSCGGTKSYQGKLGLTVDLFQAQVPDYDRLSQDIEL